MKPEGEIVSSSLGKNPSQELSSISKFSKYIYTSISHCLRTPTCPGSASNSSLDLTKKILD
jgi:hypothetical protein